MNVIFGIKLTVHKNFVFNKDYEQDWKRCFHSYAAGSAY